MSPLERHYTPAEAAELLGVRPETILRYAARRELGSVRLGKLRRFPESALRDFLAARTDGVRGNVVALASKRDTAPSTTRRIV